MSERIAMVGAGAVGGYVGGHLARAGHDVTLIDMWNHHIEAIRRDGLQLTGMTDAETFTVRPSTKHIHEVSDLHKEKPIDIALVSVKSYDTDWVTQMILPYLSPGGCVVSLQNCINEERIARIAGWGRTIGCSAARISVELHEPAKIRRQSPKGAAVVFRVGEVHGRITDRLNRLVEMLSCVDDAKPTTNLWGERWSKLCINAMRNGVSAVTGLSGAEMDTHEDIRRFTIRIAGEGLRIGKALGYDVEPMNKLDPAKLLAAADGDAAALADIEAILLAESGGATRGALQRPSMGQDMLKGRRTEIEAINGYIVEKGAEIGIPAPENAKITELVTRVERGQLPVGIETLRQAGL